MADAGRDRNRRPARGRPAARGRVSRPAPRPRKEAPEPRSRAAFTGRAVVLAVALASVMLALALPLKVFIGQRHAISKLEQQTERQQDRVDALKAQQRTWDDPAYIAAQARERLHFVKPGETAYIVLGDPAPSASTAAAGSTPARPASRDPWYTQLWHSVQAADDPPVPVKKPATPATGAKAAPASTP